MSHIMAEMLRTPICCCFCSVEFKDLNRPSALRQAEVVTTVESSDNSATRAKFPKDMAIHD